MYISKLQSQQHCKYENQITKTKLKNVSVKDANWGPCLREVDTGSGISVESLYA